MMEVKKGLNVSSSDFWYDLADGGYLKPSEILVDKQDVMDVEAAIEILKEFETACSEQIEGFIQ